MESPSTATRGRIAIWLVVAALVLLIIVVGVVVWFAMTRPTPFLSGHRWATYPATTNMADDDSGDRQQSVFAGNVKVFSLLRTTQASGEQEIIADVLCHVIIDLPPGGLLQVRGGGSDSGELYRRLVISAGQNPPSEPKPFEVRYRLADRMLTLESKAAEGAPGRRHIRTITQPGNVFIVRIDERNELVGMSQPATIINRELETTDVERLVREAEGQ